jgi:Na+-transporting NADH:ubiquinone oxidoreductase subunit NqrF
MNKKANNTGSTMVEVLVGFTLLMIMMAGLTRLIKLSSEMVFNTKDMMNDQLSFEEELYKEDYGTLTRSTLSSDGIVLKETDSSGNGKAGGINIALTDAGVEKLSDDESELSLYRIY